VLDAEVAARAEADVAARLDDEDAGAVDGERVAVVDDDDLVRLAGERVETPVQLVAAVVRDDDDADAGAGASAQYAPLRATTAGSVFARIEMSSQIDQFSR
jgi:hypothetical protein